MDGLLWLLVTAWIAFFVYAGVLAWWPEEPASQEEREWWDWLEQQRIREDQMGRRPRIKQNWQRRYGR